MNRTQLTLATLVTLWTGTEVVQRLMILTIYAVRQSWIDNVYCGSPSVLWTFVRRVSRACLVNRQSTLTVLVEWPSRLYCSPSSEMGHASVRWDIDVE